MSTETSSGGGDAERGDTEIAPVRTRGGQVNPITSHQEPDKEEGELMEMDGQLYEGESSLLIASSSFSYRLCSSAVPWKDSKMQFLKILIC